MIEFKTSSFCSGGSCVEVANLGAAGTRVRDSKDKTGPSLLFTPEEWRAFVAGVKAGEFDA